MSKRQTQVPGRPTPSEGQDRGLALAALLISAVLVTLLIVGIGGPEVRPDREGLITVQQPPDWKRLGNSGGPDQPLSPPRGDTPGRRLGEGLRLDPHPLKGQVAYVVTAKTDAELLTKARFRPGDVIMEMDGRPLGPDRIHVLGDELSLLDAVEVAFLRDGAMRKRVIDLRG